MAAVAPVPSIAYPAPAANSSSAADDASLTSGRSSRSKLSASLAALDLHSPHLPSRRDEASVSSKSVRRRDVIRSMGPVQLAEGVAEGMMPGPANLVAPGPMASPGTTTSLVLAPERKLVPPGSKSPYSYVHSYTVDSFHSKDTGALVLPPLGYPALKNHAHGDSVTDGSPTSVADGPPSITQGEGPVMLDAAGVAHPVDEGALVPHEDAARPRVNSDPIMLDSGGGVHDVNEGAMVEHTHPNGLGAMVVHEGSNPDNHQLVPHNMDEEEMIPGEHPLVREHRLRRRRGRDPDEVVRDRTLIPYDGPADPPGESPSDHPIALGGCTDLAVHGGDCEGSQYSGMDNNHKGRRVRQVRWVDPKNVKEEGQIDYAILGQYEELTSVHRGYDHARIGGAELIPSTNSRAIVPVDPPSQPTTPPNAVDDPALLLSNPRTRIATVSSGYKKANFFVREDLDTRIYFHQLEDAVGYMAKRGYARMAKEEEGEWRELLGRAHGVVKKGTKKEKQRYRKGKLVLILKKTILDHDDDEDGKRKARSSRRKIRAVLEDASRASASQYSGSEGTQTTRTSLGRSVRGPYKSYSEKFLAEQEENKRQYLLAITEGRPLPDVGYGNEDRLMLTAEEGGSTTKGGDPDALSSQDVSTRASFDETTQGGTTAHSRSRQELMKSESALSDRKGVYGGGVRYFTPDNVDDDDDSEDDTTEDEDFEEEESDYTEDEDETTEGGTYDEEEATEDGDTATYDDHTARSDEDYTEVSASDMGSMFSQEDETYDYTKSGGVESVDGSTDSRSEATEGGHDRSSTAKHGASGRGRRGPPRMEPISDDSASSNSRC